MSMACALDPSSGSAFLVFPLGRVILHAGSRAHMIDGAVPFDSQPMLARVASAAHADHIPNIGACTTS